jgi:hypothetical protein
MASALLPTTLNLIPMFQQDHGHQGKGRSFFLWLDAFHDTPRAF